MYIVHENAKIHKTVAFKVKKGGKKLQTCTLLNL